MINHDNYIFDVNNNFVKFTVSVKLRRCYNAEKLFVHANVSMINANHNIKNNRKKLVVKMFVD